MKLKGVDELLEVFNSWLEDNGFSTRVGDIEEDFGYYSGIDEIAITFVNAVEADAAWRIWTQSLGFPPELDVFWTSFLHELGHAETIWMFGKADWEKYARDIVYASHEEYFNLPIERTATEWALNFVQEKTEAVVELIAAARPAIIKFFELNEITED